MYLIMHKKVILDVSNDVTYVKSQNGKWVECDKADAAFIFDKEKDSRYAMPDFTLETTTAEIPSDFEPFKYIYENGAFELNPNWSEPEPTIEERIEAQEVEIAMLKEYDTELLYQVCLLQLGITEDEMM